MTGKGGFVEIQGTAEGEAFTHEEMNAMLALADLGIKALSLKQRQVLGL